MTVATLVLLIVQAMIAEIPGFCDVNDVFCANERVLFQIIRGYAMPSKDKSLIASRFGRR